MLIVTWIYNRKGELVMDLREGEEEEEKEVSFPKSKNISSGLYRKTKAGRVK